MMSAKYPLYNPVSIREFTASKQIGFFEALKQPRFSGQLILTGPKGEKWDFYLYLGRIMYATGGIHPVRRWRRNLSAYFPQLTPESIQLALASLGPSNIQVCWEYQLLCLWVEQQKISREQAARMIRNTIVELLFDITQLMEMSCELKPDDLLSTRLVLVDAEQVIAQCQQDWQAWQAAKIADRSPNFAPIIRQPEQLQQRTSPQVYQTLKQLLDGQQTLRDLAVRMKRDVLTVTSSLLPYIQLGLVELISIPDLPPPITPPPTGEIQPEAPIPGPLIACIDDSPLMCQTMEKILTSANYQFIGINDPLRAIAILLARKPELIFLDLVMPNANGYEICSQLRKMTFFKNTPIIILTGNDGLVDRVRAKMVGSSDFISKPVNAETVLSIIRKHLKEETVV
ncbi:response regulator receiver protein [Gloeothece citriformis PCC 7424]|uniref:Protein PatA n=1 Tax=Gloeothece citriformis (strain PCC 7424) TaxID=65393 RepID=B7K8K1_GLOC7|nr:response regulator [Gloeothece citriformis]ACK71199.1 response regulator receiver protein [Gloeothece citriformis PCC 7424]